jgi:tripartite ATP-independent transporter DctM subunit
VNSSVSTGEVRGKPEPGILNKFIYYLDKLGFLARWLNIGGVSVLFLMVLLTSVNVVLRYVFNMPISGVNEVTELLMVIAVFFALAHTQNMKAHVSVDLFTARLKSSARLMMDFINNFIGVVLFIVIVWQDVVHLQWVSKQHSIHSTLIRAPIAPFEGVIILGCALMTLFLIRDLLINIRNAIKLDLSRWRWLVMVIVPVLIAVLAVFWMQPNLIKVSLPMVGLIGVIASLALLFMGMPIAFTLFITAVVFIAHIRGAGTALDMLGTDMYRTPANYSWSVVPFFTMMGFVCLYARFGDDLFSSAYKWFGHFRGGMGMAVIGACTAFGAIVGDSVAATATMTAVALPPMKKLKYDDRLSTGCIVGGACLGPIIPPSVIFILFGLLTGVSIGDLFVGGIIPGVIMAVCFIVTIYFWCRIDPKLGPSGEKSTWRDRIISLKVGGPVIILFLVVIGGIYKGVFTPTEGGAVGVAVAMIIALISRRFSFKSFSQSLLESGQVMSMVFLILISALMFNRFLAWCNVTTFLTNAISNAGLSPEAFTLLTMVVFIIAGCFISGLSLILVGIPVVFPVSRALGIDPIWFLVLQGIAVNLGNMTPPVGINLFVLKGMKPELSMRDIYIGALPFSLGNVVSLEIVFLLPFLASWLPGILK